ncbi:MAG: glycosyltransferase family 4 protein [Patescibacteria group bacterium]
MRKRTKICYILPEYSENTAGHFYHHYEFLRELSKHLDIFLIIEKSDTNNVELTNKFYIQKFRFIPFRFLESFFALLKARFLGYRIFYTHICYIGAINAGIISRIFGGKSYYWNCAMNWLFKQRTLPGLGYKLSLKLSHYLVTGSKIMKQGYSEHYNLSPQKIKIMPNWINLNRFSRSRRTQIAAQKDAEFSVDSRSHQRKSAKPKVLLFVHWLSKRKGADMIVPIMNNLKFKRPGAIPPNKNLNLMVIGDGPYKEKLLEEIEKNKLKNFIIVVGAVPNKDLVEYYAKADLFIMPSMEEGFPRVLLEAMAMGIPYIASDVGAVREISPETAQRFLVKPGDIEMFAHKIETLLSDKELYNSFRKEELEKVKEYSLDKIVNKFIKLFK